jgi:phosphoserine phosphatase
MGEDRVRYLLEEYFEDCLQDKVLERGKTFLRSAQEAGFQTVLLSEQLQGLVALLVEKLAPVDHFLGNRLEFKNGQATGRLVEPIIGGYQGGRWLQQWSQEQGFDLKHSRAYASQSTDLLFLANVGKPVRSILIFSLRRAALEADWPIVDYC